MNSNDVRRQWQTRVGAYSPAYYAYHGPDERSEALLAVIDQFCDREASILELGCSSGRHLAHLFDNGFRNVAGIELNDDAFDVMAETYPALADAGTFYPDAIENVVGDFEDGAFDVVYSVETLQHLHPNVSWVFQELARITSNLLVTIENESGDDGDVNYVDDEFPLYYRDWDRVFTDRGLEELDVEASVESRGVLRAFRVPSAV